MVPQLIILVVLAGLSAAVIALFRRPSPSTSQPSGLDPATIESLVQLTADRLDVHLRAGEVSLEHLSQRLTERVEHLSERVTSHVDLRDDAIARGLTSLDTGVGRQVSDLRTSLESVSRLVGQLQTDRATQHAEVLVRLDETARCHQALSEVTTGLRAALANPTARGSWGERTADDLLTRAGLVEGLAYVRHHTLPCGTVPDVSFLLPQGRFLHMDVKFPADNYLRFLESQSELERERHRKQFMSDVRARVRELTGRAYTDADSTVGYMLMFIPNESIYSFVVEQDPGLIDTAMEQRVILCSPFTLYAVVAVVRQATELVTLERRSDEVLRGLQRFEDQWRRFTEQMDKLDRQANTFMGSLHELTGKRRRELERRLDSLAALREESHGHELGEVTLDGALVAGSERAFPAAVGGWEAAEATNSGARQPALRRVDGGPR